MEEGKQCFLRDWIKTLGKCVIHNGYESTGISMSKCTEMIIVSQCHYGSECG